MLAAIDDAIGDGVNILSISIGTKQPYYYTDDYIAIGALHATKKNIVVACSAGNEGPAPSTLSNPAPWIITVGASSVDREFIAPVVLGNGLRIEVNRFIISFMHILHLIWFAFPTDFAQGIKEKSVLLAKILIEHEISNVFLLAFTIYFQIIARDKL